MLLRSQIPFLHQLVSGMSITDELERMATMTSKTVPFYQYTKESCIVLVTGFSDGIDVRDASAIQEIKRISVEHGKVHFIMP